MNRFYYKKKNLPFELYEIDLLRIEDNFLLQISEEMGLALNIEEMKAISPRRQGKLAEYQNGKYFMYLVEWDEVDEKARRHSEIEIYRVDTRLILNTTDRNKFNEIKERFFENPESFEREATK